jgi:FlaA1/EpsC-like NDP-sugar epimerase
MGFLTLLFAHTWYTAYYDTIALPFYRRGNWVVIVIYTVVMYLFFRVYGGFKVGYLRRTDVLFSQVLSVFGTNLVTYLQVSLIARNFVRLAPILEMTVLELVVLVLWTVLAQKVYFALYPPRRLIIVYGSPSAAALVTKMSQRVDKYMICESVSAVKDYAVICEKILQYDGVIIQDIPAKMRNDLVKFCFDHQLRAYITPKIADIILRGAEDIRLLLESLSKCQCEYVVQ